MEESDVSTTVCTRQTTNDSTASCPHYRVRHSDNSTASTRCRSPFTLLPDLAHGPAPVRRILFGQWYSYPLRPLTHALRTIAETGFLTRTGRCRNMRSGSGSGDGLDYGAWVFVWTERGYISMLLAAHDVNLLAPGTYGHRATTTETNTAEGTPRIHADRQQSGSRVLREATLGLYRRGSRTDMVTTSAPETRLRHPCTAIGITQAHWSFHSGGRTGFVTISKSGYSRDLPRDRASDCGVQDRPSPGCCEASRRSWWNR